MGLNMLSVGVLNMISHSFAALTREISCSTLEINLVFPRTHACIILYILEQIKQIQQITGSLRFSFARNITKSRSRGVRLNTKSFKMFHAHADILYCLS
jgi:hypothetical protein